jgi:hypothetical protein
MAIRRRCAGLAVALLFAARPVFGAPPSDECDDLDADEAPAPALEQRWYGWQILAVDGAADALAIVTVATHTGGTYPATLAGYSLAAGGYLFGGPIVHAVHGHGWRTLGSFGLRLGAPLGGALLGLLSGVVGTHPSGLDEGGLATLFLGVVGLSVGVIAAQVLDPVLLGSEDLPRPRRATVTLRVIPQVDAHSVGLGVVGGF